MQRKGLHMRTEQATNGNDKLMSAHGVMTTNTESRWGVRYHGPERNMDTFGATAYHSRGRFEAGHTHLFDGPALPVCSAQVFWPALDSDRVFRRHSANQQLMHTSIRHHSPPHPSRSPLAANHRRPRSYLSAGLLAARRINADVSQLEEKQAAHGQQDSQDDSAEPP